MRKRTKALLVVGAVLAAIILYLLAWPVRTDPVAWEAPAYDPAAWKRVVRGKKFRDSQRLAGDSLKRPPRGYDPEHPLIEDLKRKDFISVQDITRNDACSPGFAKNVEAGFRAATPLVRFLTGALDLDY